MYQKSNLQTQFCSKSMLIFFNLENLSQFFTVKLFPREQQQLHTNGKVWNHSKLFLKKQKHIFHELTNHITVVMSEQFTFEHILIYSS